MVNRCSFTQQGIKRSSLIANRGHSPTIASKFTSKPNVARLILTKPYIRAERMLSEWHDLTSRAGQIYDQLPKETQPAFFQLVYMLCAAQENLNKLHIAG